KAFTVAVECDPTLGHAYLSRGLARVGLKCYEAALDDFKTAAGLGEKDVHLQLGRGQALEALGRSSEADSAFESALRLATGQPHVVRVWTLWLHGNTVAPRLPDQAQRAFEEVLLLEPGHAQAFYGLGMLAVRRADVVQALPIANRDLTLLLHREEAIRSFN